jgi:hypothetical protein
MNKNRLLGVAVAALIAAPVPAFAQGAKARGGAVVGTGSTARAARTVKGLMRGNVIAVRSDRDQPLFDFVLSEARLVDGKLELEGSIRPTAKTAAAAAATSATLVGTLAKEPSPEYAAARARRNAARSGAQRNPASGETAKQKPGGAPTSAENAGELGQLAQSTQSTARTTPAGAEVTGGESKNGKASAAATGISGCEVVFLKMQLPARYAARAGSPNVQLNVALAQLDNRPGTELNQPLCRVVYALESKDESADAELERLNAMLSGTK